MATPPSPPEGAPEAASAAMREARAFWTSLDPAVRAELVALESKEACCPVGSAAGEAAGDAAAPARGGGGAGGGGGAQGRRANAESGPRIDGAALIGGDSFVAREANPGWLQARRDVYDAVKARRDAELRAKVPQDIEVTLPDGKVLAADRVRVGSSAPIRACRARLKCVHLLPLVAFGDSIHDFNFWTCCIGDATAGGRPVPVLAYHAVRRGREHRPRPR